MQINRAGVQFIECCKEIVEEGETDSPIVGLGTANAVLTTYDNLSEENKQYFTSLSPRNMIELAWKFLTGIE